MSEFAKQTKTVFFCENIRGDLLILCRKDKLLQKTDIKTKRILALAAMALVAVAMWAQQCPVSVRWQMGENSRRSFSAYFTIKNTGSETLGNRWALYYNKFSNNIKMAEGQPLDLKPVVNYNYVCLSPNDRYKSLGPGEEITVEVVSGGNFRNKFFLAVVAGTECRAAGAGEDHW